MRYLLRIQKDACSDMARVYGRVDVGGGVNKARKSTHTFRYCNSKLFLPI